MTEAHGKFVWNELNTRDIESAKRFLSTTLGWTFESMPIPDGTYWIAKKREERIGGLYDMNGDAHCKDAPEHWLSYIAVDNVDERYKKALAAGAKEGRAAVRYSECRPHCYPRAAGRRHDRLDHPETDVMSN